MLRTTLLVALVAATACTGDATDPGTRTSEPAGPGRANVILIMTDDQDVASLEYMPLLRQRMVERGTTFRNAFVTTSLCCPSRTSTMLGSYAHNHGLWTNFEPRGGFEAFIANGHDERNFGIALQEAGYRTGWIGKFINGYDDERYAMPGRSSWYAFGGYFPDSVTVHARRVALRRRTYSTDIARDRALAFIRARAREEEPWFLWVNTIAPHNAAGESDRSPRPVTRVPSPALCCRAAPHSTKRT